MGLRRALVGIWNLGPDRSPSLSRTAATPPRALPACTGNAIKELQELSAPTAVCRRDGAWVELAVRELVPGDVVELKARKKEHLPACLAAHPTACSAGTAGGRGESPGTA